MARYFFHSDGALVFQDQEGVDHQTFLDAQLASARFLSDVIRNSVERFWDAGELNVTVEDEAGLVLFRLNAITTMAPGGHRLASAR